MISPEEYKKWYSSCEFIQEELQFYSFQDFVEEAFRIKKIFQKIDDRTKKLYQWYVFANHIGYSHKCLIWNFLNNYNTYDDLLSNIKISNRTKK